MRDERLTRRVTGAVICLTWWTVAAFSQQVVFRDVGFFCLWGTEGTEMRSAIISSNKTVVELSWATPSDGGTATLLRTYWLDGFWSPDFQVSEVTTTGAVTTATVVMEPEPPNYAVCSHNLYIYELAKRNWAAVTGKVTGDPVTFEDLEPFVAELGYDWPLCPSEGIYTLTVVGAAPVCSVQGDLFPHAVPARRE